MNLGSSEDLPLGIGCILQIMPLTVVEYDLEHPRTIRKLSWFGRLPGQGNTIRRAVAVLNTLQIAIGSAHAVALVG